MAAQTLAWLETLERELAALLKDGEQLRPSIWAGRAKSQLNSILEEIRTRNVHAKQHDHQQGKTFTMVQPVPAANTPQTANEAFKETTETTNNQPCGPTIGASSAEFIEVAIHPGENTLDESGDDTAEDMSIVLSDVTDDTSILTDDFQENAPFTLRTSDLGENLVAHLARFVCDERFTGKVIIQDLDVPDFTQIQQQMKAPPRRYDLVAIQYEPSQESGVSKLLLPSSKTFRFPDFTIPSAKPSESEVDHYLQILTTDPPNKAVPYYVGPPLSTHFDGLLDLGDQLSQSFPSTPGVNKLYWHAGEKFSGTVLHKEDGNFRSVNICLFGWKYWLKIKPDHTTKAKTLVQKLSASCDDIHHDQLIRHQSLLISPQRLTEEGIEFDTELAGPGCMIVTETDQLHYVINLTHSFAIAINFLLPGETILPDTVWVCKKCGLYPYRTEYPQIRELLPSEKSISKDGRFSKRKSNSTPCRPNHAKKYKPSTTRDKEQIIFPNLPMSTPRPEDGATAERWQDHIVSTDRFCKPFPQKYLRDDAKVLKIALAARSSTALKSLFELVSSWRHQGRMELDLTVLSASSANTKTLVGLITSLDSQRTLYSLLSIIAKIQFAHRVDEMFIGMQRLDTGSWERFREHTNIANTTCPPKGSPTRNRRFSEWRELGRKMQRYPVGLLCLIPAVKSPPCYVSYRNLEELKDDEAVSLCELLGTTELDKLLLDLGGSIISSIESGSDIIEHIWETSITDPFKVSETEVLEVLAPFPQASICSLNIEDFTSTPKPDLWPIEWPTDPAIGDGFPNQCDFCDRSACECSRLLTFNEISECPRCASQCNCERQRLKGRMVSALFLRRDNVNRSYILVKGPPSQVIYEKDDVLGELIGQISPPNTYSSQNPFVHDVRRSDLLNSPVIYQICWENVGNWTRNISHQCSSPTVFLRSNMVSGKHRVLLVASRNIVEGDEITITLDSARRPSPCFCVYCYTKK
ncbi:hypothetical protein BX600DRAFT_452159 [Xylariales sp. PMI_506]|nr:hypothetical protein BX600DRAFT_452159 [Xylariales sp. PMI_506]